MAQTRGSWDDLRYFGNQLRRPLSAIGLTISMMSQQPANSYRITRCQKKNSHPLRAVAKADAARLLIERGANVNATVEDKDQTPLCWAACNGKYEVAGLMAIQREMIEETVHPGNSAPRIKKRVMADALPLSYTRLSN